MSQTAQQYNEIARTLREGMGMAAGDRLQRRQQDIADKQTDYTLMAAERERNDPTKILGRQNAQAELTRLNAPVTYEGAFGDQYGQLFGMYQPKDGRPPLANRVESMFGAKFDSDQGSKTHKNLVRPDGSIVTQREWQQRLPEVANMVAMEMDPDRQVDDEQDRTIDAFEAGHGDPAAHAAKLAAIDAYWKDPNKRVAAYQRKLDFLMGQSSPEAQALAEKTQAKIDTLQKSIQPEWTEPKEAVVSGKRVMVQYDKRTGKPRVVPGVQPTQDGSWGQPIEVTDPQTGQVVLVRQNSKTGQIVPVQGYGPGPKRGIRVVSDGKGGTTVETNAEQDNSALTKPNVNKQQENLLGLQDQAARLSEIERMYNPSFLTAEGRFKDAVLTGKDFLNMDMSPEEREFYTKRNEFMTGAYRQINQYIKDITGAALSEAEAKRIMAGAPNPNDPPTRYASKLKATMRDVKMAMMRSRYALTKGLDLEDISIDRMPAIIDRRGDEIEQQILKQNPGATPQQINSQVRQQLKSEFGMEI